ncbi:hypothetical protein [Schlesneria paludicola]|uniref:hypothetical protein n=1 Tax=Schlesneria paludicola TaxID=360056 RepID=UPI0002F997A4|nr:hypothetical protein [Schlesneria paludicola]
MKNSNGVSCVVCATPVQPAAGNPCECNTCWFRVEWPGAVNNFGNPLCDNRYHPGTYDLAYHYDHGLCHYYCYAVPTIGRSIYIEFNPILDIDNYYEFPTVRFCFDLCLSWVYYKIRGTFNCEYNSFELMQGGIYDCNSVRAVWPEQIVLRGIPCPSSSSSSSMG